MKDTFVKAVLRGFSMEEVLKEIVSGFVRMKPDQLSSSTPIGSKAVYGSIQLHRMYAKLAEQGIVVQDYRDLQTYGDLLARVNNGEHKAVVPQSLLSTPHSSNGSYNHGLQSGIGIDVEPVSSFSAVNDFREDEFYKMNFSATEISYGVLQPNPVSSFAGMFAAKEAIVKADNALIGTPFNSIIIDHDEKGKPVFRDFELSISHTDAVVIAVAVRFPNSTQQSSLKPIQNSTSGQGKWFALFAILLSLVAISLYLFH